MVSRYVFSSLDSERAVLLLLLEQHLSPIQRLETSPSRTEGFLSIARHGSSIPILSFW